MVKARKDRKRKILDQYQSTNYKNQGTNSKPESKGS